MPGKKSTAAKPQQLHKRRGAKPTAPMAFRATMPSMRDLAISLGVSVATVSRALRGDPAVRKETRDLVCSTAEAQGYRRNAFVGSFMSSIRKSTAGQFKANIGLLWGHRTKSGDRRLEQIRAGVFARAEEQGYSLSEFDLAAYRTQSMARILYNRGISGVLLAVPSFTPGKAYLRFDFSKFCFVSLGWGLFRPMLHTVRFDYFQAIRLALHHTRHAFGGRIAAVWDEITDLRSHRAAQASFLIHHPDGPGKAHKLFLNSKTLTPEIMSSNRIECLLVSAGVTLPAWISGMITDSHIVRFEHPGTRDCFGWVDTQNTLLGNWGVDLLTSKLASHEKGIPESCQVMLVPPMWRKDR